MAKPRLDDVARTAWSDTALWQQLVASDDLLSKQVTTRLSPWLDDIQAVLRAGGTSPTDFTLHDAEHSFRVAQRMAEVVPDGVRRQLGPLEIAILLLSAYLHDIGMSPKQDKVQRHWLHLVYGPGREGQPSILQPQEEQGFQQWLDDEHPGTSWPLANPDHGPSPDDLARAGWLITHYCRHRHNDWSEEWTREFFNRVLGDNAGRTQAVPPFYAGFVDDLVRVCRSHHYGYEKLIGSEFDPRQVGGGDPQTVHLRFLACALRVADVLENDPERTPEVIFSHRSISPGSVPFWFKDHAVSVSRDGDMLVFQARPEHAVIEKAVRTTIEWIQEELQLCARIDREKPFHHAVFARDKALPHRWNYPHSVHADVQPKDGAYVYIDGAFRPNTTKLLEMLGGTELYGDKLAAVRELIQNAFDAVREQIALDRLTQPNPADDVVAQREAQRRWVRLSVEERGGRHWLVCHDNGIGMTERIIRDYLLVSGNSSRRQLLELDRRCRDAGFFLDRTGKFGIGVLSYFVLAERVEIRTRRGPGYDDQEQSGWHFTTEGVGSFGELKRDRDIGMGTEVAWQLRRDEIGNIEEWYERLRRYLISAVIYSPCHLQLTSTLKNCRELVRPPGWIRTMEDVRDEMLSRIKADLLRVDRPVGRPVSGTEEEMAGEPAEILAEIQRTLEFHVVTGGLRHSFGRYRAHVPYFRFLRGNSPLFLRLRDSGAVTAVASIDGASALAAGFPAHLGWKGITVAAANQDELEEGFRYHADWDLEVVLDSAATGRISVHRNTIELDARAREAITSAVDDVHVAQRQFFSKTTGIFASANSDATDFRPGEPIYWARQHEPGGSYYWESVKFPVTRRAQIADEGLYEGRWKRAAVGVLDNIDVFQRSDSWSALKWPVIEWPPDVVLWVDRPRTVAGLWTHPYGANSLQSAMPCCKCAPAWRRICGFQLADNDVVWNVDHPLVRAVDGDAVKWGEALRCHLSDCDIDDIMRSPARAAWYLLNVAGSLSAPEIRPEFVRKTWDVVAEARGLGFAKSFESIDFLSSGPGGTAVHILSPSSSRSSSTETGLPPEVPQPGAGWVLTVQQIGEKTGSRRRRRTVASKRRRKSKTQ